MFCNYSLADESATIGFGGALAEAMDKGGLCIYLRGDLGAGKTTLSRGIITALGHRGAVKSPTYTLVEPYELEERTVYHFDLYRLVEAAELEFLGVEDYFSAAALCLVEWPARGEGFIPAADLVLNLWHEVAVDSGSDGCARALHCEACSPRGVALLSALTAILPSTLPSTPPPATPIDSES